MAFKTEAKITYHHVLGIVTFFLSIICSARSSLLTSSNTLYTREFIGPSPIWYDPIMVQHAIKLIRTYHGYTGRTLVDLELTKKDPEEAARQLFFLPTIVVSHGIQDGSEGPILNYGNAIALKTWKATWEELTTMPSKYTADDENRAQRALDMEQVTKNGFIDSYSGIRIALDKSRFRMSGAAVWNVVEQGVKYGQAAHLARWESI